MTTDTTTPQPANALPSPERARELLADINDEVIGAANNSWNNAARAFRRDTAALLRDQIELRALLEDAVEALEAGETLLMEAGPKHIYRDGKRYGRALCADLAAQLRALAARSRR